jgi:hypothetical protein
MDNNQEIFIYNIQDLIHAPYANNGHARVIIHKRGHWIPNLISLAG